MWNSTTGTRWGPTEELRCQVDLKDGKVVKFQWCHSHEILNSLPVILKEDLQETECNEGFLWNFRNPKRIFKNKSKGLGFKEITLMTTFRVKYQTFRLLILVAETVSPGFSVLWLIYRWPGNLSAIVKLLHWLKALRLRVDKLVIVLFFIPIFPSTGVNN